MSALPAYGAHSPVAPARRTQPPKRDPEIPDAIWEDRRLKPMACVVYGWMAAWSRKNPDRFPTRSEMVQALGCSLSTLRRSLKSLIGAGYLGHHSTADGRRERIVAFFFDATGPTIARTPVFEEHPLPFPDGGAANADRPWMTPDCVTGDAVRSTGDTFRVTPDTVSSHPCAGFEPSVASPRHPLKEGVLETPNPHVLGGVGGESRSKESDPMQAMATLVDRCVTRVRERFPQEPGVRAFVEALFRDFPARAEQAIQFGVLWKGAKGIGIAKTKAAKWSGPNVTDAQVEEELATVRPRPASPLASPGSGPKPDMTERPPTAEDHADLRRRAETAKTSADGFMVRGTVGVWRRNGWIAADEADALAAKVVRLLPTRPESGAQKRPAAGPSAKLPPRPAPERCIQAES